MRKLFTILFIVLESICLNAQNTASKLTSKPNLVNYQVTKPILRQGTMIEKTYYDFYKTRLKESYSCMSDGMKQGNYFKYFQSGKKMEESVYHNGELRYMKVFDEFGNILQVGTLGSTSKIIFYNYKKDTEPAEKKLFVACLYSAIETYLINAEIYEEDGKLSEKFVSNLKASDILDSKGKIKDGILDYNGDLEVNGLLIRSNGDTIKIKDAEELSVLRTEKRRDGGKMYLFQYGSTANGYCFNFRFVCE